MARKKLERQRKGKESLRLAFREARLAIRRRRIIRQKFPYPDVFSEDRPFNPRIN
jgi:hypothetical protein